MSVRGKWCLHDLSMDDDVLKYLQSNVDFINYEEKELESNGFTRCVDYPSTPTHIYYEGYFHGLASTSDAVKSMNPRTGSDMMKPAAPLALRAFVNAFKELNHEWITEAVKGTFIEEMNLSECLFCDFTVQIHFGDSPNVIGWHTDAINSMLHLALSLGGKRALHYKVNEDMLNFQKDKDTVDEVKIKWMDEGNVYLSSPYAFTHGVEYPKTSWDNRIIATQCRLLLNFDQYIQTTAKESEHIAAMNKITEVMSKQKVLIPTLEDVKNMELKLESKEPRQQQQQQKSSCHIL